MPSPSYDDRLIAMFDSYCKEVSRNYIKDLVRKNDRRGKYVSHEPVDYLLELLGHEDAYPSHAFTLEVDGYVCMVENETLYRALSSLKERQRKVLLLGFWCSFTDGEIAARIMNNLAGDVKICGSNIGEVTVATTNADGSILKSRISIRWVRTGNLY